MKKLLILIVIIVVAGALYYVRENSLNDKLETSPTTQGESFRPDPGSATFTFDEESVTLSDGENSGTEDNAHTETSLLDETSYGDLNNDDKEDAVVLIARSGGGSGVFIYVAAYVSGPVNYKGSNAIFLGDRIAPQTISVANGVVTVSYLDRRADEPFAAEPTVPVSKNLVFQNGELRER